MYQSWRDLKANIFRSNSAQQASALQPQEQTLLYLSTKLLSIICCNVQGANSAACVTLRANKDETDSFSPLSCIAVCGVSSPSGY